MRHWRSIHVGAGVVSLVAPLAALAEPGTGAVTTGPLGQQAPALGIPLLAVLAVALAGITVYRLRTAGRRTIGIGLVATLVALAGIGYALMPTATVAITGADCMKLTVSPFSPLVETLLKSECSNLIQIIDIQISCNGGVVSPNAEPGSGGAANDVVACTIGQILANGNTCALLGCI